MRSTRNRRGKSARMLTVGEIKRAICTHENLAPVEPLEQRRDGGIWQTKLVCPACGAWTIRATPDTAGLTPDEPAWERCMVELRCQERQARTYPLCCFEAVAVGPTGRVVVGMSAEFDNGIEQVDRQALLDAFAVELLRDRWQSESLTTDRMPRFRRPVHAAVPAART
jgi:hypothetical protein